MYGMNYIKSLFLMKLLKNLKKRIVICTQMWKQNQVSNNHNYDNLLLIIIIMIIFKLDVSISFK